MTSAQERREIELVRQVLAEPKNDAPSLAGSPHVHWSSRPIQIASRHKRLDREPNFAAPPG